MHVSHLLRRVLKQHGLPSGSSNCSNDSAVGKRDGGSSRSAYDHSLGKNILLIGNGPTPAKRTCLCSPTSHAGSFRCRLHRSSKAQWGNEHRNQLASKITTQSCSTDHSSFDTSEVCRTLPRIHLRIGFNAPHFRPSRLSRMVNASDFEHSAITDETVHRSKVEADIPKMLPGGSSEIDIARASAVVTNSKQAVSKNNGNYVPQFASQASSRAQGQSFLPLSSLFSLFSIPT
ncbi:hypothetical protein O6H91_15G085900 [Diphasiastrum complanatum]|uniref:Uncharacterized protein n=1 Tax=Diphasiastrum complanatum TaxID=34168 RepID=A0ACC2BKJ4_DIPCM|nr:hypothetical protein O6H91_Y454400 [Diphasiastrum complanatum]KAJ7530227.1 hypothetical protein O6H91_15G085900 [Diphasiastrum complanatum]